MNEKQKNFLVYLNNYKEIDEPQLRKNNFLLIYLN